MIEEDKIVPLAVKQGFVPQYFCKYRPWPCEYTKQIITNHTLYFSTPDKFNDPSDCNPIVKTKGTLYYPMVILTKKNGVVQYKQIVKEVSPDLQKEAYQEFCRKTQYFCSFSRGANINALWAHYANNHQGLCFVFDITQDPKCFLTPLPVFYSDDRPKVTFGEDIEENIQTMLNTKGLEWQYEDEVRIWKPEDRLGESCNVHFDVKALKAIIFGMRCDEKTQNEIKQLCNENGLSHIQYGQIQQDSNSFELKIKEMND